MMSNYPSYSHYFVLVTGDNTEQISLREVQIGLFGRLNRV